MNLYSHIKTANYLEAFLKPNSLKDYYLGAIIPDIRYYCNINKRITHISLQTINSYLYKYPHLKSFFLGYFVHILADEYPNYHSLFNTAFKPFITKFKKYKLSPIIEFYFLDTVSLQINISTNGNSFLDNLGIQESSVKVFAQTINTFLKSPSIEAGLDIANNLSIINNKEIDKYLGTIHFMNKHKLLRKLFFKTFTNESMFKKDFIQYAMKQLKEHSEILFQ